MRGMRFAFVLLPLVVAAAAASATAKPFPGVLPLPKGWQPEGIASGPGNSLYVGSIPTGAVLRLDARTGRTRTVVPKQQGRAAIGLKVDGGRIYVAGGPTGRAFVYDADTGATIANVKLTDGPTFVNDVTLTRAAAYFTDSQRQQLYRLDRRTHEATTIRITGELAYDNDPQTFEANGIAATRDGKALYVVQSATGKLFTISPSTGMSTTVAEGLPNGDGLLLAGRTLYVAQNRRNRIAVVDLNRGRVTRTITDSDLDVPTTLARKGRSLYAVNARFGTPATPETEYAVVRLRAAR